MAFQPNTISIEVKVFSDLETKAFNNGGSVVKFQAGFLESSWFDAKEKKTKYKNGFITVKKNIGEKMPAEAKAVIEGIAKGDKVCIVGHLGYEEWEKEGKKVSKIVLVADHIYPIAMARGNSNASRNGGGREYDAPDPDDDGGRDRNEIPF